MARTQRQNDLLQDCDRRYREQIERARQLTVDLDKRARRHPRSDGGWSIDENIAHLAQINRQYMKPLASAIRGMSAGRQVDGDTVDWKPSTGGRLLIWASTTSRSMKTPGMFRPEHLDHSGDPLSAFTASQKELCELLDESRSWRWRDIRLSSPASRLVRLNAGDVFVLLADHNDRHLNEVERLRDEVRGASG